MTCKKVILQSIQCCSIFRHCATRLFNNGNVIYGTYAARRYMESLYPFLKFLYYYFERCMNMTCIVRNSCYVKTHIKYFLAVRKKIRSILTITPITFKFGSEVGFEKCSKFYWNHFLFWVPVSELGELFKIAKFKNPIFRKIKNLLFNLFVFRAIPTTIHTFLKSSDKTVIMRQGQKSDIATGQGSGVKFSLYRRTHCTIYYYGKLFQFWIPLFRKNWIC